MISQCCWETSLSPDDGKSESGRWWTQVFALHFTLLLVLGKNRKSINLTGLAGVEEIASAEPFARLLLDTVSLGQCSWTFLCGRKHPRRRPIWDGQWSFMLHRGSCGGNVFLTASYNALEWSEGTITWHPISFSFRKSLITKPIFLTLLFPDNCAKGSPRKFHSWEHLPGVLTGKFLLNLSAPLDFQDPHEKTVMRPLVDEGCCISLCVKSGGKITNLHGFLEMHLSESWECIKEKSPGWERLSLSLQ